MNRYQVITPNGDILLIKADAAKVNDDYVLTFTTGKDLNVKIVAQFLHWNGWNLLEPVEEVKVTPVAL